MIEAIYGIALALGAAGGLVWRSVFEVQLRIDPAKARLVTAAGQRSATSLPESPLRYTGIIPDGAELCGRSSAAQFMRNVPKKIRESLGQAARHSLAPTNSRPSGEAQSGSHASHCSSASDTGLLDGTQAGIREGVNARRNSVRGRWSGAPSPTHNTDALNYNDVNNHLIDGFVPDCGPDENNLILS